MSSETNSEITSRNLSRVSGFGYRENISTRSVRDSKADLPGLLRKLRTGIIGKRIISYGRPDGWAPRATTSMTIAGSSSLLVSLLGVSQGWPASQTPV
jgi:hypothetical protein